MIEQPDTSPLSIQTISADGKAPKRRMATSTAAFASYIQMRQANMRRDARFGDIAGIYAGLPPTPPNVNERNGMADLPNINTKQFQAKVNTYTSTWTAINSQGDGYAEISAEHDDPMEAERRSKVITEEFNRCIRLWDNPEFECGSQYVLESAARDSQMGLYGIGCAFMRDPIDFRFRMIPTRRVLVPEGTRLSMDNCPAMFIEDTISVTDLYGMCDKQGWNKKAILRSLYLRVEILSPTNARRFTFSEWVNQIRANDTWLLNDFMPVRIIHGFVKEFDGSITQVSFTDLVEGGSGKADNDTTNKDDKEFQDSKEQFLYEKTKVAERWQQIIIPFADNAGPECDWHGVKGFGDLIFDGCHLNNLMFNRAATGAVLTNMLMFKGIAENDTQKLDQITLTNLGLMAPGLEFEQIKFAADIDGALSIVGMGSQLIAENTRISPQNEKTTTGDQPTATQVAADRTDRAQFTTLQVMIYRAVGLDVLFSEMFRRLAQPTSKYPESWGGGKVAKRFRERCEKRGIPEGDLLKVNYVRANRNNGSGDMALDLMKAKELLGVATPGRGQMNARKEVVTALKGPEMVPAFIEEAEPMPGKPEAELSMEQNLIQLGQVPTAFGWQDQEKHVTTHMQLMGEAAELVAPLMEQGLGPQNIEGAKKLNNLLDAGIQHVTQHLQLMAEIPRTNKQPSLYEQFSKMVEKQLHNLQQLNQSFGEDIQKADVAQQPQMSPEMMKAQQEMQIRAAEATQELEFNDAKNKQKLGNLAVATQARTEMKKFDQQVSAAQKAATTEQELRERSLKTIQELQQKQALHQQELQQMAEKPTPEPTE